MPPEAMFLGDPLAGSCQPHEKSSCRMRPSFDPSVRFRSGLSVSLSEVESSPAARVRYLAPWHDRPGAVLCLCRTEGIPMGVAKRQTPTLTYYLYPLHRTDPTRHALACPHRRGGPTHREAEGLHDRACVIQSIDGRIRVNLTAPLYQRPSPEGTSEPHEVEGERSSEAQAGLADEPRERPPAGNLLTLLHLLWTEAELNAWRPGFSGRRPYAVVAKRLVEAVRFVEVKRVPLEPLFLVPPPFRDEEARKRTCDQTLRDFLDILRPDRKGRRYYGFVAGLLRAVTRPRESSVAIQLAHMGKGLWLTPSRWHRARRTFWPGLDDGQVVQGGRSFVLLRVSRQEGRQAPWLRGEDLVALRLLDSRTWLPAETPAHRMLVAKLVEEGREFRCPLSTELEGTEFLPDAVLEDRGDRAYVKIRAFEEGQGSGAQVDGARDHWEAQGQAVCWWDPSREPPSAVPPKEVSRARPWARDQSEPP